LKAGNQLYTPSFVLSPQGVLQEVKVERSSGYPDVDCAACLPLENCATLSEWHMPQVSGVGIWAPATSFLLVWPSP